MIFITIEEIAKYVKKEIIRDLFADIYSQQCVIDVLLNDELIYRNISSVARYFLNDTKEKLVEVYKKRFTLFFRKLEYEKILDDYLVNKYNIEQKCLSTISFGYNVSKWKERIQLDYISQLNWEKKLKVGYFIYEAIDKDRKKYIVFYSQDKKQSVNNRFQYDKLVIPLNFEYPFNELITCIEKTNPKVIVKNSNGITNGKNRTKKSKKSKEKKSESYKVSKNIYEESLELNMIARKYKVNIDSLVGYVCDIQKKCIYCQGNRCFRLNKICYPYYKDCILYDKFMNKLLMESQSRNKSSRSQAVVNKKSENKQGQGKSNTNTQSKKKLYQIGVKDFVVRSNVFHCIHQSHQIQNVDAVIRVCMNNGDDKQIQISAGYCEQCKVYFIMESTYQELKRKGIILCRVTDSKTYMKGDFINGSKLAQESILMQYGYNVSRTVGLTERQRQKILAVMIDNSVLSKGGIISYLDFFIRQHSSRNNMGVAISKWEADREFVEHYRTGEYTQFGVNAIYRR